MEAKFEESRGGPLTLELLLVALSGGALDIERLEADMDEVSDLARLMARLWEFPVESISPSLRFSPCWEEISPER